MVSHTIGTCGLRNGRVIVVSGTANENVWRIKKKENRNPALCINLNIFLIIAIIRFPN